MVEIVLPFCDDLMAVVYAVREYRRTATPAMKEASDLVDIA